MQANLAVKFREVKAMQDPRDVNLQTQPTVVCYHMGKKITDVYCTLTNALTPTKKKEDAFLWQRTGLQKYISSQ